MNFKKEIKSLVSVVRSDPAAISSLRNLIDRLQSENINWIAWIILKCARKQKNTLFAHSTEKLLLRRLTPTNYEEYAMNCLRWGSWEFKLVLLRYFLRRMKSVLSKDNVSDTLNLVKTLMESFEKETEDRFGLQIHDVTEFVGEMIIENVVAANNTINGKQFDIEPKVYQKSIMLRRDRQ